MSALKHIFECEHHSPRTSLLDKGIYPKFKECWLKPAVLKKKKKKKKKKPVPGARDTGRKRKVCPVLRQVTVRGGEQKNQPKNGVAEVPSMGHVRGSYYFFFFFCYAHYFLSM